MSALIQLLQTAENLLNRGETADGIRFVSMALKEAGRTDESKAAADAELMSWEETIPGKLEAIIKQIEQANDCEIGTALDAMEQLGDLQSGGPWPIYACIKDKLQAAKNDIESLCAEAAQAVRS